MKKYLILIIFLISPIALFSQIDSTKIEKSLERMNTFEERFSAIDEKIANQNNEITSSFDIISCQINSANFLLMFFSLVVAITGIGLSIWISRRLKNVTDILEKVENTRDTVNQTKLEIEESHKKVVDIQNNITTNISQLYKDITNEEVRWILEKLRSNPQSIQYYERTLLVRDLQLDAFSVLRDTCLHLHLSGKGENEDYRSFMIVFFQNFITQTCKDISLRNILQEHLDYCIETLPSKETFKSIVDLLNSIKYQPEVYRSFLETLFEKLTICYSGTDNSDKEFLYELIVQIFKDISDTKFLDLLKDIIEPLDAKNNYFAGKFLHNHTLKSK